MVLTAPSKTAQAARYIMANRRAGKFDESDKLASRNCLDRIVDKLASSVQVLGDRRPNDEARRRIVFFEADPAEIEAKKKEFPDDVIVEQEILHYTDALSRNLATFSPFAPVAEELPLTAGAAFTIQLRSGNLLLAGIAVTLFLRGAGSLARKLSAITDIEGVATFSFNEFWTPTALLVLPAAGYWSFVVRGPINGMSIEIPELPRTGPLAWWHQALGINDYDPLRGLSIKVGVADTGVGPHDYLQHVHDIGSFLNGTADPQGGADVDAHGSHVCGTIGARPTISNEIISQGTDYAGIAPGTELYCARVFPPDGGANQGDIADAIDALSKDHQVDLINLSLGASSGSQIVQDAIRDARERGTLCICAAGNEGGPVGYPAAFPECIAVSALGLEGWGPDGTLAATRQPPEKEKYGAARLYLANFSCFGPEIDCCAPGVGIISTVPHGIAYAVMDGTSMASPAACGALAAILSASQGYRDMPRDESRTETARALLKEHCRSIGLDAVYQGAGIPKIS